MSENGQADPQSTDHSSEKAQRLRIRFSRGGEAGSIGHLDIARVWERTLREAGLSLSYSQGARSQARITLAAGLPVGVTSDGELLDAVLAGLVDPTDVAQRIRSGLPPGLDLLEIREVGMGLPSLPASVRWADYDVDVQVEGDGAMLEGAIESLIAASTFPWVDTRGEKTRQYDLRPLVQELRIVELSSPGASSPCPGALRLSMRLRCASSGVGRADQVVKALGLPEAARIHRRRLVLAEASPAHDAWRRKGRFLQ